MIEIVGVKSMQGGFQLKWVGTNGWIGLVSQYDVDIVQGMMCAKLQGKGTDLHGPTSRIGWEKRKWGDAGGGTLGTTYAGAQLLQEVIHMHWGSSYSNPPNLWGGNKYPMHIILSRLTTGNDSIAVA